MSTWKCEKCGVRFCGKRELEYHKMRCNWNGQAQVCLECGREFRTVLCLSQHVARKHKRLGVVCTHRGHKHSSESKNRMRKTHTGLPSGNKNRVASNETRRRIRLARMRQIFPSKDTSIEVMLQNELRKRDIQFETHKPILGQPDIFIEPNICVFADGDYWHNLSGRQEKDREITMQLKNEGYKVLRFWEHEIKNRCGCCVNTVVGALG